MKNFTKIVLTGAMTVLLLTGCAAETIEPMVPPTTSLEPSANASMTPTPTPTMTEPTSEPSPTEEPAAPLEVKFMINPDELIISSNKTVSSNEPYETSISYFTAPSKVVTAIEEVTGMEPVESYSGEEWCYEDRTTLTWGDSFYIVFRGQDATVAEEYYVGQKEQKTKQLNPFVFSSPSGIQVGDDFKEALSKVPDATYDSSESEKGSYEWFLDGVSTRYPAPESEYDSYGVLISGLNGVVTHVTAPMWISDHC